MKAFVDIFRELDNASTEDQKIAILRSNSSPALFDLLRYGLSPTQVLYTDKVPTYTKDEAPDGLAFSHLYAEMKRFYLLTKDYPISQERKEQILIQILESLGTEAPIMEQLVTRKFKSLSRDTVETAFPGLIISEQVKV